MADRETDVNNIYCGKIGDHDPHIWATQEDKPVSCLGVDWLGKKGVSE